MSHGKTQPQPKRKARTQESAQSIFIRDPEVVALVQSEMNRTQQKTMARTAANVIRRALYTSPTVNHATTSGVVK
jgi:hypothetical protein